MKKLLYIFLFLSGFQAYGQGQMTLYQMHRALPQSNLANPAFYNETKNVVVGLPVLNSTYIGFRSPISFDDAFNRTPDDSLELDTDEIVNQIEGTNRLDVDANVSILFVGVRLDDGVLTVGVNSRVDGGFGVPGEILSLAIQGDTGDPNQIFTANLGDIDLRYQVFHEIYGGYNHRINDKLILGGRVKFLKGLFNVNLENFGGTLTSSIDSINIRTNAFVFQTAGFDDAPTSYYTFGSGNNGLAFDIGATYEVIPNLYVSASAIDLGFINWKDNVKSYNFDAVDYTFEGVDFLDLIEEDDPNTDNTIDQELDSLQDLFDPTESTDAYSNALTSKYYLAANYRLANIHQFGVILYGDFFQSSLRGAVGVTYDITLAKILSVGLNASYKNNRFDNFGAGLSLMLGPVQLYGLADRLNTIFNPENAKLYSFRVGMNLVFGKTENGSIVSN